MTPREPSEPRLGWWAAGRVDLKRSWVPGAVGLVLLLVLWEVLALTLFARRSIVPTPVAVAQQMWNDRGFYGPHVTTTLGEAATGYLWGNALALVLAVLFVQVGGSERLFLRLAIATYCMPIIAIGPLLKIVMSGTGPNSVLAGLSVILTTLIGAMLGLRSADRGTLEVVRAYGGGTWAELTKVRLRAALPATFAGLQIAGPAALLGAIVGEYLGGDRGLGVALLNAGQTFQVRRTWGLAALVTVIAVLIYVLTAAVGRALTPWFRSTSISVSAAADSELRRGSMSGTAGTAMGLARSAASLAVSLAVIVGLWYAAIAASGLNRYIAKTPDDVWTYLFAGEAAATRRSELFGHLAVTLRDAGIGYVSGTVAAVVVALAVVLSRAVQQTVMPMAIALRSVPLVAMTPLLALIFGRGIVGVTVIVGIVTFFPTLVNVVEGLRSAPAQSLDLIRAFGGGSGTTLRRVQLPYALPAVFASAKIAAPGALLGAMLAEWLATGHGLGYLMLLNSTTSKFASLWSATVLITVVSVLIYNVVGAVEKPVLRRFSLGGGAAPPR